MSRPRSFERLAFRGAVAVLMVHAVDDAVLHRQPGLGLGRHLLVALGGAAFIAVEISNATGDGAVDEHVVRDPVEKVVVDAEDGDVTLVPAAAGVHVRVRRDHFINSPDASERLVDGVLELKTRCPLGFVRCRSDYRLGIPPGVTVTVDKPSGRVDALAVGGGLTELSESSGPLNITRR